MKIHPSELNSPKAVRAHAKAQQIVDSIDKMVEMTRQQDQTPQDRNPTPGEVAVTDVLVERRATYSDIPIDQCSSDTVVRSGVLMADDAFRAQVSLPGLWSLLPIGLDAEVSRREANGKRIYDQKHLDGVSGAKRFKITVDQATGEIDFRQYYDRWGLIRKPV